MEQFRFLITQKDASKRLDIFLSGEISEFSRSKIQKAIKEKQISVNGEVMTIPHYALKDGDEVVADLTKKSSALDLGPDPSVSLQVVWENENFLVIKKPAGMVVEPETHHPSGTLLNGLLAYDDALQQVMRAGIIHRIDKDVSGLLIVARNNSAASFVKKQFKERTIYKEYTALVHGIMEQPEGKVDFPISRSKTDPRKMAAHPVESEYVDSKEAVTLYEVLKQYQQYALLKVIIKTGRTHQIRVHLNAIGHPLVGDQVYRPKKLKTGISLDRIFLHASRLSFHDMDGSVRDFQSELPEELQKFLQQVR